MSEFSDLYRERCFEHHGRKCEICAATEQIHVHHINGDKLDNSPPNLMPLCASHHRLVESNSLNEDELECVQDRLPDVQVSEIRDKHGESIETRNVIVSGADEHKIAIPVDDRGRVTIGKQFAGETVEVVVEVVEDSD